MNNISFWFQNGLTQAVCSFAAIISSTNRKTIRFAIPAFAFLATRTTVSAADLTIIERFPDKHSLFTYDYYDPKLACFLDNDRRITACVAEIGLPFQIDLPDESAESTLNNSSWLHFSERKLQGTPNYEHLGFETVKFKAAKVANEALKVTQLLNVERTKVTLERNALDGTLSSRTLEIFVIKPLAPFVNPNISPIFEGDTNIMLDHPVKAIFPMNLVLDPLGREMVGDGWRIMMWPLPFMMVTIEEGNIVFSGTPTSFNDIGALPTTYITSPFRYIIMVQYCRTKESKVCVDVPAAEVSIHGVMPGPRWLWRGLQYYMAGILVVAEIARRQLHRLRQEIEDL